MHILERHQNSWDIFSPLLKDTNCYTKVTQYLCQCRIQRSLLQTSVSFKTEEKTSKIVCRVALCHPAYLLARVWHNCVPNGPPTGPLLCPQNKCYSVKNESREVGRGGNQPEARAEEMLLLAWPTRIQTVRHALKQQVLLISCHKRDATNKRSWKAIRRQTWRPCGLGHSTLCQAEHRYEMLNVSGSLWGQYRWTKRPLLSEIRKKQVPKI